MKNWIIKYHETDIKNSCEAKITSPTFGEALRKAEEVIDQMNEVYSDRGLGIVYKLDSINNYDALEDWTAL